MLDPAKEPVLGDAWCDDEALERLQSLPHSRSWPLMYPPRHTRTIPRACGSPKRAHMFGDVCEWGFVEFGLIQRRRGGEIDDP